MLTTCAVLGHEPRWIAHRGCDADFTYHPGHRAIDAAWVSQNGLMLAILFRKREFSATIAAGGKVGYAPIRHINRNKVEGAGGWRLAVLTCPHLLDPTAWRIPSAEGPLVCGRSVIVSPHIFVSSLVGEASEGRHIDSLAHMLSSSSVSSSLRS